MIVRSVIALGHGLGLHVVAEGVEDRETWAVLSDLDCDVAQGYTIAPSDVDRPPPQVAQTSTAASSAGREVQLASDRLSGRRTSRIEALDEMVSTAASSAGREVQLALIACGVEHQAVETLDEMVDQRTALAESVLPRWTTTRSRSGHDEHVLALVAVSGHRAGETRPHPPVAAVVEATARHDRVGFVSDERAGVVDPTVGEQRARQPAIPSWR